MKFTKNLLFVCAVLLLLIAPSCNDDDSNSNADARVQLKLVDAPGDYLEVNIEIIDIRYNDSEGEDGWKSFGSPEDYPMHIDLTTLIAGNSFLLTDEEIPPGMLKQIRLVLSDQNTLVIEGETEGETITEDLDTPSSQQSGLKLKIDTELEPGFSYTFILDWDVNKSIVKAGNSGKYILKPTINVIAEVNSGTIEGHVIGDILDDDNPEPVPLQDVLVMVFLPEGTESIASTTTDAEGNFTLSGLAEIEGGYIIKIEENAFIHYQSEPIMVTVGAVTTLETIELIVPVG